MPCHIVRSRPMTLREAKLAAGMSLGGWMHVPTERRRGESIADAIARVRTEEDAIERTKMVGGGDAPFFICGKDLEPTVPCGRCGCSSENLCDHPMGGGRTCDMPLCDICSHQIGDDLHLCEIHFREFQKKCGADQINPWPPKRGDR